MRTESPQTSTSRKICSAWLFTMTGLDCTTKTKIGSLEWFHLYEAFVAFKVQAERHGLYADDLRRMEDDLFERCPIPQPKKMEV